MPMTNFPQGVRSFGIPLIGAGPILTTGNVFFVNSSHPKASNGNLGTDPEAPFATIDFAIGKCSANNGDYIIAGPGHVEILQASGDVTFDVAGVTLIGIGSGAARPTFSCRTSTAARVAVSAANVTIQNMLWTGDIDALISPLLITAADFKLLNCTYRDVTGQATAFLQTNANANRLLVDGFEFLGDAAAGCASAIHLVGGSDAEIRNFLIKGNFSAGAIEVRTTAATRLWIHDGLIRTANAADLCIRDLITGSTGWVGPNLYLDLADNAANITEAVTGATFRMFGPVRVVNADNEQAMDINWTVSTDA